MGVWNAVLGVFGCAYGMLASLVEWKERGCALGRLADSIGI